jgi:hypothetical protein
VVGCGTIAITLRAVQPSGAQSEPKVKIALVGDSTADGLWGGLTQLASRTACMRNGLEFGRFGKNSTGLTRPDRFDWANELKMIEKNFAPQIFIMSLGLNDRQSVVEKGQITMDSAPGYPAKYKERVTTVLKNIDTNVSRLIWVGLPAMRNTAADKDARDKNKLFAEATTEFGSLNVTYVEPWRLSEAGEDKFQSYGPDVDGKIVQIRNQDGAHFTTAGELVVATYLWPKIHASLGERGERICSRTAGKIP